ncbi:hypothetical protein AVEN_33033-1 [Araneus ventricosus]|uniref:Uncharacterized protein n=1 Tax=Araneus ventricosus TaxID=182803 RepID=A0A4Y2TXD6_ARAVE|nr:hypothetical protein AVEN_4768-1 [Araneus ventricosus]GBO05278.1 hypothetical protein AVEN_239709-1 [Araneus ventricosus]GBO06038.1 hypothetical protein AVEN_189840-1 [Araneus ventricosus]GBO06048.1 hypothetical protein AVEN_33033-1 [Araneus ventricosus]
MFTYPLHVTGRMRESFGRPLPLVTDRKSPPHAREKLMRSREKCRQQFVKGARKLKVRKVPLSSGFSLSRIRRESIVIVKKFELEISTDLHVLDLPESEKHNSGIMSVCL